MRLSFLLLLLALAGCKDQLTTLELGDRLPPEASPTGELILVAPAQMLPKSNWQAAGIEYALAADLQSRVQYISTKSRKARTPDGVYVGQSFAALSKVAGVKVTLWPGWGYVVELPSGWKAALFLDGQFLEREPLGTDEVDLLFKGTVAGYGS